VGVSGILCSRSGDYSSSRVKTKVDLAGFFDHKKRNKTTGTEGLLSGEPGCRSLDAVHRTVDHIRSTKSCIVKTQGLKIADQLPAISQQDMKIDDDLWQAAGHKVYMRKVSHKSNEQ
jgi:hypothetical protein